MLRFIVSLILRKKKCIQEWTFLTLAQIVLEKNVQTIVKAASQKVSSFSVQQINYNYIINSSTNYKQYRVGLEENISCVWENGCMHGSSLLRLHLWRDGKILSLNSVSCLNLFNITTFQGQTTTDIYFEVPAFIDMLQYGCYRLFS